MTEESDVRMLSGAVTMESPFLIRMCNALPPHRCLIIGKATNNLPFIVDVKRPDVKIGGETKGILYAS